MQTASKWLSGRKGASGALISLQYLQINDYTHNQVQIQIQTQIQKQDKTGYLGVKVNPELRTAYRIYE